MFLARFEYCVGHCWISLKPFQNSVSNAKQSYKKKFHFENVTTVAAGEENKNWTKICHTNSKKREKKSFFICIIFLHNFSVVFRQLSDKKEKLFYTNFSFFLFRAYVNIFCMRAKNIIFWENTQNNK